MSPSKSKTASVNRWNRILIEAQITALKFNDAGAASVMQRTSFELRTTAAKMPIGKHFFLIITQSYAYKALYRSIEEAVLNSVILT